MRNFLNDFLMLGLLLATFQSASAEPDATQTPAPPSPVSTDAPTISRSSHVVGDGVTVLETSYTYTSTRNGSPPSTSLPLTLRHGVSDNLEIRLETNGYTWQGQNHGFSDVALGFKYEFVPDWAVVGLATFPTGAQPFRTPSTSPFVSIAHDQQLGELDGLLFNAGATFLPNGTTQALGTIAYSRMCTSDISWFMEGAVVGADMRVDTGLQIWVDPNFVVNLAVLRGLSGGGQDWGGTVGFGARF